MLRSADQIVELVDDVERATSSRQSRMDDDRKLMRLEAFNANTDV